MLRGIPTSALGFGLAEPLAIGATWEEALKHLVRRLRVQVVVMAEAARACARMRAREFLAAAKLQAEEAIDGT